MDPPTARKRSLPPPNAVEGAGEAGLPHEPPPAGVMGGVVGIRDSLGAAKPPLSSRVRIFQAWLRAGRSSSQPELDWTRYQFPTQW